MTHITAKGRELASKLNPSMGTTMGILRTCSLIARHAVTHKRYQEMACSLPNAPSDAHIESRIRELVANLPHVNGEQISVHFSGDPRGCTVKLVMPDGRYDDWGGEGLCVPQ